MPVCRSCRAPIRWEKTRHGKSIPLDPEPRDDGNVVMRPAPLMFAGELVAHVLADGEAPRDGETRFRTHFVSCPNAGKHRRRR